MDISDSQSIWAKKNMQMHIEGSAIVSGITQNAAVIPNGSAQNREPTMNAYNLDSSINGLDLYNDYVRTSFLPPNCDILQPITNQNSNLSKNEEEAINWGQNVQYIETINLAH